MRTATLIACLVLLFAVPALAEVPAEKTGPSSVPPAPEASPLPPVTEPLPAEPRACTASLFCGDVTVMCTGNSICTVNWTKGGVICDGVETPCPNRCKATRNCNCNVTVQCWSYDGDCSVGCCPGYVNCDGDIFSCAEACEP